MNALETNSKQPRVILCQARDCNVDCTNLKVYCQRKHLCEKHLQAATVHVAGSPGAFRFCFQCGRLEKLDCFDGKKRTCRVGLARRRSSPSHPRNKRRLSSSTSSAEDADYAGAAVDLDLVPVPTPEQQADLAMPHELQCTTSASITAPSPTASGMANSHASNYSSQGSPVPLAANAGAACYSSAQLAWQPCASASLDSSPVAPAALGFQLSAGNNLPHTSPIMLAAAPGAAHGRCPAATPAGMCMPALTPQESCGGVWGDASQLQLILESELTAAGLSAALASSASSPLDPDSRMVSQQLAAALVQDSSWMDCADMDLELESMFGPPVDAFQSLKPAPFQPVYKTSSCADSSSVGASRTLQRAAAAPAAAVAPVVPGYSPAVGCQAGTPFALQQVAAPAYSSTVGPLSLMTCPLAGVPAAPGMPLMYPQHMLVKEQALFPASVLVPADIVLGAAKEAAGTTYSARLQELAQQMSVINAHLSTLKAQLGMMAA